MTHSMRGILALLSLSAAAWIVPPLHAATPLRVCLQADDPPLSSRHTDPPAGFDVALARLIAERLGRPFQIQWFITRDDPDSNPVTEADALLSDGHCELVAGYPLVADKLGRPRAATGKLPPFGGAKPEDRGRWISLGQLAATRAYRFDGITVALAPTDAEHSVHTLADLAGLKLGLEIHGLPDLIAMTYRQGALTGQVVHFDRSPALFAQLESSGIDAALVDQREFDAWRLAHPGTRVVPTTYWHSIGFNIGYVGLSTNAALIEHVNTTLAGLLTQGNLDEIARTSGMTYLPPRTPDVSPGMTLSDLSGD